MTRQRPPHLQLVAADGRDVHNTCHHVARQHTSLDSLVLDPIEDLALSVLRHLCASFGNQTTLGWERAHDLAESALGPDDGPVLVAHLVALLRAVRSERAGCFSYMAADCPTCNQHITDEELLIIRLLRAARVGEHERIAQLAASLAQGAEAPHIGTAAVVLGSRLAAYALRIKLQTPPPELPAGKAGASSGGHAALPFQRRPGESGHAG
jgi:hypothetical protein